MRNYGLVIEPIVIGDHYVFGGYGSLGGEVLQPDASWLKFLPDNESQLNTNGFDPMACATFGTFNAAEMLNRRLYGTDRNWSDRFLAKVSGTTPQGNDPHKVAEALRHYGAPNEADYPYPQDVTTWEQFYAPIAHAIEILAQAFIDEFDFGHEWVWTTPTYLTQALKYSPIGISVTAWFKDEKGLYYKPEGQRDNHWCVLVGFVQGEYWLVYDSYADNGEFVKKLRWDFAFQVAKRYSLNRQVVNEQSWVEFIIGLVKAAFGFTKPTESPAVAPISPVEAPKPVEPSPTQTPAQQPQNTPKYDWSTPQAARHSVRLICDEEGLSVRDKNDLCGTVGAESGWNPQAVNRKTKDYGIAQINEYYHIGPGKDFSSIEYVTSNPEVCIRWMCKQWKLGHREWWIAFKNGSYKNFL